jgi:hypothetical protein
MVMYHRRSGGQSQHSTLLDLSANEDRVQRALNYARQNLSENLTIEDLARAACLSPRQFYPIVPIRNRHDPGKGGRSTAGRGREADAGAEPIADRARVSFRTVC